MLKLDLLIASEMPSRGIVRIECWKEPCENFSGVYMWFVEDRWWHNLGFYSPQFSRNLHLNAKISSERLVYILLQFFFLPFIIELNWRNMATKRTRQSQWSHDIRERLDSIFYFFMFQFCQITVNKFWKRCQMCLLLVLHFSWQEYFLWDYEATQKQYSIQRFFFLTLTARKNWKAWACQLA